MEILFIFGINFPNRADIAREILCVTQVGISQFYESSGDTVRYTQVRTSQFYENLMNL